MDVRFLPDLWTEAELVGGKMDDRERKNRFGSLQRMTIKDAIFVLNCVEAHGICIEAKKMAIQSLEAWEKVKTDIQKEENILYHDCEHDFSKNFDVIRVDTVLEIIDKHLVEVEK